MRFDRHEWAGAFGDMGTDLPLIIGMIAACGLDAASTLIVFGGMQIITALVYGMPMAVQPLKAVAALAIAGRLEPRLIQGAGLSIGLTMLVLALTGSLDWLSRIIPKAVIRGIQAGLGLKLILLALGSYVLSDGWMGIGLAAAGFVAAILLLRQRRYPAALFLILLGVAYALAFKLDDGVWARSWGLALPRFQVPSLADMAAGFILLALPQIPLSLGNSIVATRQMAQDLFPEKKISVRKIGITYALMNVVSPFLGGIPICHGAGGLAGHYAFGGRTGGSVVIYGSLLLALGLCFSGGVADVVKIFPLPILGVMLVFEGVTLLRFMRDVLSPATDLALAAGVALVAAFVPNGFLIGMVGGTALGWLMKRFAAPLHGGVGPRSAIEEDAG